MAPNTTVDKIRPYNDPRISLRSAHLNGRTYGYLYSTPPAGTRPPPSGPNTILLIHGFPDLSLGWRYQIPFLISLGLTVIAPDCLGYGRSESPPPTSLQNYGYKRIADDLATLCSQLGISDGDGPGQGVLLGGHDWGGAIVYRVAQYYPKLVKALFSICTPYSPPNIKYEPLEVLVEKRLPNFRYQCHFVSGDVEDQVQSKSEIRAFLNAMYGARGPKGKVGFEATVGVDFANLPKLGKNPLLDDEEMDYYVTEYGRHGMNGPLNWYRNREVNYMDEYRYFFEMGKTTETPMIEQETLFVLATKDQALKPFMAERMGDRIGKLTREEVVAGHWALWQKPAEVNAMIREWLQEKVWVSKGGGPERSSKL